MDSKTLLSLIIITVLLAGCDQPLTGQATHARFPQFSGTHDVTLQGQSLVVNDDAIYRTGWYASDGDSEWTSFTLLGDHYPGSEEWLASIATHTLPSFGPGEHYVIIYSCSRTTSWDCHDQWQLQVLGGELSLTAWATIDDADGNSKILVKPTDDLQDPWEVYALDISDGNARFVLSDGTPDGWRAVTTPISLGTEHFLAGTYDGQTMKLYVDGALATTQTISLIIGDSNQEPVIGSYPGCCALQGTVKEAQVHDHALTEQEILEMYGETPGCTGPTTQQCTITHGTGTQTRTCDNYEWSEWGTCTLIACDDGYEPQGNACVEEEPRIPVADFLRTFYVANDGDDSNDGTSPDTPWKTIEKVNAESFMPGDGILFRRGDLFIGSLTPPSSGNATHHITFGAYGDGEKPIITPNDYIEGLTWTAHGNGIYKTTDIPFNPGNILIDGTTKINKINDQFFTKPHDYYFNYTSLDFLAIPDDFVLPDYYSTFSPRFWDGLDALYAYDTASGTTYIRFRGGDDPNDYSFAIAPQDRFYSAVTINRMNYIVIQNLHIVGGERGVYVLGGSNVDHDNVLIENNLIESSNVKTYLSSSKGIVVRNNTFKNNYLSPYRTGAWSKGTTYEDGVQFHYYRFFKIVVTPSSSCSADGAIVMSGGYSDNSVFYNNTVIGLCCGFSTYGDNLSIHDNYIEGTSSIGVYLGMRGKSYVHDNHIVDSNIPFRFGSVDRTTFDGREHYVYRNTVYSPDAGEAMYIHYDNTGPSVTKAYIYHNSFISIVGPQISGYVKNYPPHPSGFVFVNNIISTSQTAFYTWSTSGEYDDLFTVDYNWISGRYYGKDSVPWAPVPHNIEYPDGPTFWDHSINPPDFTDIAGTEVIDAGIDVSQDFVLGGTTYKALPGISASDYVGAPDIGAFEHQG